MIDPQPSLASCDPNSFCMMPVQLVVVSFSLREEERENDIPIVGLNPGGILNWKYKGETRLRNSPLRHCIVRATGLIPEGKGWCAVA